MKIKPLTLKKLSLLLFALMTYMSSQAQYEFEVYGYVYDSTSGQILKNAEISLKGEVVGKSNSMGYYQISVPPYENELTFEHNTHLGTIYKINVESNRRFDVALIPITTDYETFKEPSADASRLGEVESGKMIAPIAFLDKIPQLGDEPDLFRSLQRLPGIDFGNESNVVLNVRGGSHDQNQILYNGVPVYKSTQLFNTLSFQIAPVDELALYKGSSPARFGGRLSSDVDINTLDGIAKEPSAEFALSLTSAKFKLTSPIKPNKSSMSLSLRRSYIDILFPGVFFEGENTFNFYDINFKFNREINPTTRMSFFSLFTKDNLLLSQESTDTSAGVGTTTTYKTGVFTYNLVSGVQVNKRFNKNLFGEFTGAFSGNALRLLFTEQNLNQPVGQPVLAETHFNFGNYDIVLNADMYANRFNKHSLNFGVNVINHNYATGVLKERNEDIAGTELESETTGESDPERTFEIAAYVEDEFKYNDKLDVIVGLRAVQYQHPELSKIMGEPRVRLRYEIDDKSAWRASFSRNNQVSHFLSYASGNFYSARWVPATEKAPIQNSNFFSTSYIRKLNSNLIVEAEAYYKKMNNILISEDGFLGDVLSWENLVIPGEGKSYGFEVYTAGQKEHFSFAASYALSYAKRRYDGINSDEYFDYDFDRRHMFKSSLVYERRNEDEVSFNYTLGTGRPFSVPNSKYRDIDGQLILGYDEINNYRSSFYHRVDVSYTRYMFKNATVQNFIRFSVYNALMSHNASQLFVELDKTVISGVKYKVSSVSYLVIIPSISYNLRF